MASMPAPAATPLSAPSPRRRTGFLDLPEETQKEIFEYCSDEDLICLSLVSRHFRDLAAEQLYHLVHIIFPNEGDRGSQDTMNDLPLCLDTFATSDYNYAQHLRHFAFDTPNTGMLAESSYKNYHYNRSAGKFLNTLMLLTLRKARKLETLVWNVRIEISRQLYKVLHNIDTLVNVEIRLQSGPSLYEPPPKLPLVPSSPELSPSSTPSSTATVTPVEHSLLMPPLPQPSTLQQQQVGGLFGSSLVPPIFYPAATSSSHHVPSLLTQSPPTRSPQRQPSPDEPPTISGFKNLKCFGVLDIDCLDVITEIATCVQNSAGTLTELRLSFSENLARKARKMPPLMDGDSDSELDDPFGVGGLPLSVNQMPIAGDSSISGANKHVHMQEAKKEQESALGKIFGIEQIVVQQHKNSDQSTQKTGTPADVEEGEENEEEGGDSSNFSSEFVSAIRAATSSLMASGIDEDAEFEQKKKKAIDLLLAASKKYVDSEGVNGSARGKESASSLGSGSTSNSDPAKPEDILVDSGDTKGEDYNKPSSLESSSLFKGALASPTKLKDGDRDVCPEDIDVEAPEGQLVLDPQDSPCDKETETQAELEPDAVMTPAVSVSDNKVVTGLEKRDDPGKKTRSHEDNPQPDEQGRELAPPWPSTPPAAGGETAEDGVNYDGILAAQLENLELLKNKLDMLGGVSRRINEEIKDLRGTSAASSGQDRISQIQNQISALHASLRNLDGELRTVKTDAPDDQKQTTSARVLDSGGVAKGVATSNTEESRRLARDYVRSTRGLALEILALYLIPVKASVISKAVDLRVLKNLTLLNVGPQAPIWTLLARENKVQRLPLRTIVTDNISNAFLNFASQLDELHNLYLLEREAKHRPESLAPKTTSTIDDIRRMVLRKHAATLRVLSIRNLSSQDWDMDEATVKLLSRRARRLEELAISMNMQSIHAFLQFLPGFTSLLALHVIRLRNDDTCVWVMQETKRFLIDTLSHYPHLKLEYLAIDSNTSADQIIRVDVRKEREKKKEKKRAKATKVKGKEKAIGLPGSSNAGNGGVVGGINNTGYGANTGFGTSVGSGSLTGLPPMLWNSSDNTNSTNNSGALAMPTGSVSYRSDENESDEDDDSELSDGGQLARRTRLKLRPVRMSNIWSTRIFEKEVISGRL